MKTILLFVFTLFSISSYSQSMTIKKGNETLLIKADVSEACNPEMVFMIVEQMPTYKGGVKKLEHELNESIKVDPKLEGEINIWSTINCEGKAFGFQTVRFLNEELEIAIIEELIKLQNWESGKQRNKRIDTVKNIRLSIKKGKITVLN